MQTEPGADTEGLVGLFTQCPAWEEEPLATSKRAQPWQGDLRSVSSLPWAIPAAGMPRPRTSTLAFWATSDLEIWVHLMAEKI